MSKGNPNLHEAGKPFHWKPGQSGNPGGRPKSVSIRALLKNTLAEPSKGDASKTRLLAIIEQLVTDIEDGKRDAMELFKFLEGNTPPEASLAVGASETVQKIREILGSRNASTDGQE